VLLFEILGDLHSPAHHNGPFLATKINFTDMNKASMGQGADKAGLGVLMEHMNFVMQQDSDHGLLLRSLQTLMKQASPITQTSLQEKGKHMLTPFYKLP